MGAKQFLYFSLIGGPKKPLNARSSFNILASLYSGADWFDSYLVGNPEDRFSGVKAYRI